MTSMDKLQRRFPKATQFAIEPVDPPHAKLLEKAKQEHGLWIIEDTRWDGLEDRGPLKDRFIRVMWKTASSWMMAIVGYTEA